MIDSDHGDEVSTARADRVEPPTLGLGNVLVGSLGDQREHDDGRRNHQRSREKMPPRRVGYPSE